MVAGGNVILTMVRKGVRNFSSVSYYSRLCSSNIRKPEGFHYYIPQNRWLSLLAIIKYSYARARRVVYVSQWSGDFFFFFKELQVCCAAGSRSLKLLDNVGFIVECVKVGLTQQHWINQLSPDNKNNAFVIVLKVNVLNRLFFLFPPLIWFTYHMTF